LLDPHVDDHEQELFQKDSKFMKRKTDFCKPGNREFWEKRNVVYRLSEEIEKAQKRRSEKTKIKILKKTQSRSQLAKRVVPEKSCVVDLEPSTTISDGYSQVPPQKRFKTETGSNGCCLNSIKDFMNKPQTSINSGFTQTNINASVNLDESNCEVKDFKIELPESRKSSDDDAPTSQVSRNGANGMLSNRSGVILDYKMNWNLFAN